SCPNLASIRPKSRRSSPRTASRMSSSTATTSTPMRSRLSPRSRSTHSLSHTFRALTSWWASWSRIPEDAEKFPILQIRSGTSPPSLGLHPQLYHFYPLLLSRNPHNIIIHIIIIKCYRPCSIFHFSSLPCPLVLLWELVVVLLLIYKIL